MGRKRTSNPGLPLGVTEKAGVWYWHPPTKRERDHRKALKAEALARGERFTIGCTLGPAGSKEARLKWAEVSGYDDPTVEEGTVRELLRLWKRDGIKLQANGEPRAESTIEHYLGSIPTLEERFGDCRYAKTEEDAARGRALGTVLIQTWIDGHPHAGMRKREFAVLDNAFAFAIRKGKTTYNPCSDAVLPMQGAREREPMPWEVECLRAVVRRPRLALMMDMEAVLGWRVGDLLALKRAQGTADGIRVRYRKRGKRWLWEWSPETRRIWQESLTLPGASPFPASPVFPTRTGGQLSYSGFEAHWQGLKRETNAALAAGGIIDPDTLRAAPGPVIEDLHFHDLRSKVHDDAEELGIAGHEMLGNSPAVARRHYSRRERRARPLK